MPNPKPRQPRRWTTDKQREAARRNGAKSKGPATAAGKSRSALNNLHYGIHTQSLDLCSDPDYTAKFRDYLNRFLLPDHSNLAEIEALVSASLRRRKINVLEAALFNANFDKSDVHSYNDIADELEKLGRAERRETNRHNRIWRNMQNQFRNSNPTTEQLQSLHYLMANFLVRSPQLFHNPDSIIKSYD